ncbi:MAG: DUF4129 domain-containing protein [Ruminococcaceae bacterium]|nr:DUF4129 domain-containing protein [Oscillospiraceae bacterium]
MNADKKLSGAAFFRTLQYFTAAMSVVVMIYTVAGKNVEYILGFLPAVLLFLLCTAVCRRVNNIPLLVLTGAAVVAAGILVPAATWDKVTCTALALTGYIAALLERKAYSNVNRKPTKFLLCLQWMAVPMALFLFCSLAGLTDCSRRLFVCSVIFLPLTVGAYLNEGIENGLAAFESRSTQPMEVVQTRLRPFATLAVSLTALGAMLVPYSNGMSLMKIIISALKDVFLIVFGGLSTLLSLLLKESPVEEEIIEEELELGFPMQAAESNSNEIILAVLGFVVFTVLAAVIIVRLVKFIIFLVRKYTELMKMRRSVVSEKTVSQYDTFELLDPEMLKRNRPKRSLLLSSEEKVRLCYRRKIRQLSGRYGIKLNGSETPDEIAAITAQKGCDITALTALYKKARYSRSCTADDVKEAKRLAREEAVTSH